VKRTFTLRGRLAFGALGIALVLAIPLVFTIQALRRVHQTTLELRNGEFAASLLLGRFREGTDELRRADDALLFVHDERSRERMARGIAVIREMADSLDVYNLHAASTDVRLALDSLTVLTEQEYLKAVAGASKEAEAISSDWVRPRIAVIEQTIAEAEQMLRSRTRERVDAASVATAAAERAALTTVMIALLLAIIITIWLIRSISKPVHDLQRGMQAVSSGDFSYKLAVPPSRQDEFGRLSASFQAMSTQLAELDKLKAEFVSIASHELKTPINVILGYIELLQEGIYGRLNDAQREVCGTIASQAQNLTRLVRRLLDVSRFEAGGGKIECRPMDLGHFLDSLQSSFNALALQRGVHFRITRAEGLPTEVRWDEDRMNEVVGNILSNAFKFTPRGGEVELSASAVNDHIQLEIRDTGAGIPAEQLSRVFHKFFQADNQSKAAARGTGLGLAISKHIVDAHQGKIHVDSQVGRGTIFTITLPARVEIRRTTGQFSIMQGNAA
jgi:signal transduction histidine kinase